MPTRKHYLSGHAPTRLPADDLECNPGIGESRGTTMAGEDPDLIEGENTSEGDVANDAIRTGAIDPKSRGRTNK